MQTSITSEISSRTRLPRDPSPATYPRLPPPRLRRVLRQPARFRLGIGQICVNSIKGSEDRRSGSCERGQVFLFISILEGF